MPKPTSTTRKPHEHGVTLRGNTWHCSQRQLLGVLLFLSVVSVYGISYMILLQQNDSVISPASSGDMCKNSSSSKKEHEVAVKLAMTIKPQGRVGNLMGEYATLYALSRLNGYKAVLLPKMDDLRKYFSLSIPTLDPAVTDGIPWKSWSLHDWMEPNYAQINGTFVKLTGYPCSWTFYHHIREEILREFTFLPSIVQDVHNFLHMAKNSSRSPTTTFIGVHIRRGDYVKLMLKSYDGVLADSKYLIAAMDEYRNRYTDSVFVVSSDDLSWCRRHINMSRGDIILAWNGSTSDPGRDLALLSHCNHSIMTIGTFGYWASYLAGGDVIYLNNFTRSTSKFNKVFRPNAAFLPHWKGLAADLNSTSWL